MNRQTEMSAGGTVTPHACVLVVEDEELVRDLARNVLDMSGFRVLCAADGREAVEMFKQHEREIDVVLLDMSLPLMSGKQVLAELKRLRPNVRVLLTSGYNEDDETVMGPGNVTSFLPKPYRADGLVTSIQELLAQKA